MYQRELFLIKHSPTNYLGRTNFRGRVQGTGGFFDCGFLLSDGWSCQYFNLKLSGQQAHIQTFYNLIKVAGMSKNLNCFLSNMTILFLNFRGLFFLFMSIIFIYIINKDWKDMVN